MEQPNLFCNGGSGSPWLMLRGLALMRQASFFECMFFDLSPSLDDGPVTAEMNVGRRQVAETFVIAAVIVALDEGADAGLEVTR